MKRNFIIITLFFAFYSATAQDIIIFKDSSTVKAKVIEITANSVIYSRFGSTNPATYTINKNSIATINYEDGRQETFQIVEQNLVNQDSTFISKPSKKTTPLEQKQKKGGVIFKVGLAMPLGAFAADPQNVEGSFGVFGGDADYDSFGQAGVGYMIGAHADIPVSKFGLGVFISLDVIMNPLNKKTRNKQLDDFTNEVEQIWGSSFVQGFDSKEYESGYVKNQLYFNIPLMAGVSYTYPMGKKFRFFVDAGLGANIFNVSTLEAKSTFSLDGETYTLQEYYDWKNVALTFCYKMGIGTVLWNKLSIDIQYYGLGSGSIDYKYQRTTPQDGATKPLSGTVDSRISMMTFGIGYYF